MVDVTNLEQVWEQLSAVHARIEQQLTTGLRRTGLGLSEYRVLNHLDATRDREIRMLDLADLITLNQSSISRLVARLEKLEYVYRQTCGDDRRGVYVVLTDAGRAALAGATPVYRRIITTAFTREIDPARLPGLTEALFDRRPGILDVAPARPEPEAPGSSPLPDADHHDEPPPRTMRLRPERA